MYYKYAICSTFKEYTHNVCNVQSLSSLRLKNEGNSS